MFDMFAQSKTLGGALKELANRVLPESDPERIYLEWLVSNASDLRGAVACLGKRLKKSLALQNG